MPQQQNMIVAPSKTSTHVENTYVADKYLNALLINAYRNTENGRQLNKLTVQSCILIEIKKHTC